MTRRTCVAALAGAIAATSSSLGASLSPSVAATTASGAQRSPEGGADINVRKDNDTMRELFEISQNEKKGVMLYVKGQSIPGTVVKIAGETLELRNREYSRIVVRIECIDAAAIA